MLNGKYRVESVLGEGGFGITYLAVDTFMNEAVAIKEYFPSLFVTRDTTFGISSQITVITGENEIDYEKGLTRFEKEVANLAKFQSVSGIVSVKSFFKENNTGYMVMEYIDGITLKSYLHENGGKLSYDQTILMMQPIMDALSVVHKEGIIHRDISPDNIMVTKEGVLKLIDFGAARYVGQDDKSLTVLLKEGYAPPEQYRTDGKQGAWTDIYALCATMYWMISGEVPIDSISRVVSEDKLKPLRELANVPKNVDRAIMKGMSISQKSRYKTIEKLDRALQMTNNALPHAMLLVFVVIVVGGIFLPVFRCINVEQELEGRIKEKVENNVRDVFPDAFDKGDNISEIWIDTKDEDSIMSDAELFNHVLEYTQKEIYEIETDEWLKSILGNYLPEEGTIIDDFDGDGNKEICALLKETETFESDGDEYELTKLYLFYSDGRNVNWYLSDDEDVAFGEEETPLSFSDSLGIKAIQFGATKQIEVVHLENTLSDVTLTSTLFQLQIRIELWMEVLRILVKAWTVMQFLSIEPPIWKKRMNVGSWKRIYIILMENTGSFLSMNYQ